MRRRRSYKTEHLYYQHEFPLYPYPQPALKHSHSLHTAPPTRPRGRFSCGIHLEASDPGQLRRLGQGNVQVHGVLGDMRNRNDGRTAGPSPLQDLSQRNSKVSGWTCLSRRRRRTFKFEGSSSTLQAERDKNGQLRHVFSVQSLSVRPSLHQSTVRLPIHQSLPPPVRSSVDPSAHHSVRPPTIPSVPSSAHFAYSSLVFVSSPFHLVVLPSSLAQKMLLSVYFMKAS